MDQEEEDDRMAIFVYDEELKKVVPIEKAPTKLNNTKDHVNMRTTWSGTTKIEFGTTTMDEHIKSINGGK